MKPTQIKVLLICFLVLSAICDLITTLYHKNFLVLESNVMFLSLNRIEVVVIMKILVITTLAFMLFYKKLTKNYKFFLVHLIIVFTVLQFFVAGNNVVVKNQVVDLVNTASGTNYTVNDIPAEEIQKFVPTQINSAWAYISLIFQSFIMPLLLALISFIVYNKLGDDNEMQRM